MDRERRADLQLQMGRLARGEREAFHPVFEALWPTLRRLAGRHLPAADAEEVAQETLVRIFGRASEFDPDRNALAWAIGIAGFEIRTRRQRLRRRREVSLAPAALDARPDAGPTPDETALARDTEELLRQALGALRAEDAETLRLYARGDRPAIAAATFRKRVERALRRLRTIWRMNDGRS
jgi:RNA polymerase sigma-70 factor (ECF subfamily)